MKRYVVVFLIFVVAALGVAVGKSYVKDTPTSLRSLNTETVADNAAPYVALLETQTPREVLDKLYQDNKNSPMNESQCHEIAHEIGHTAYEAAGNLHEPLKYQDVTCNGGYVHGVFESAFIATDDSTTLVQTACTDTPQQPFTTWQCAHGVGHGLMFANDQDLVATMDSCQLFDEESSVSACINGAVMQYFTLALREYTDDELLGVCDSIRAPYNLDCYLYAPIAYLNRHPDTYDTALDWCTSNLTGVSGSLCETGVVTEATKRNISDIPAIQALCLNSSLTLGQCTRAIINMQLNHHANLEVVDELCVGWEWGENTCRDAVARHLLTKQ